jgi:dTDP-4-amino-4,6-dideoxy-D-galactose acyltransferase
MNAPLCQLLPWDSEFFGLRIGQIHMPVLNDNQLAFIDEWVKANDIDCLYFLAESNDTKTTSLVENFGFHLVDLRVSLDRSLLITDQSPLPEALKIIQAKPHHLNILRAISRTSFKSSRFYADPNFPNEKCDDFFDTWITNSYLHGFADEVFVAELHSETVGFITCSFNHEKKSGSIDLIGVIEQARGNQIGYHMVNYVCRVFRDNQLLSSNVVTQGANIPAIRLYEKAGFAIRSIKLWYHWWKCSNNRVDLGGENK